MQLAWNTWHDDVHLASEILAKAPSEMSEMREIWTECVTDDDKLDVVFEMRAKMLEGLQSEENKARREASHADMGRWIADYLDDAGYEQWLRNPEVFKAIFVATFPPNKPLDGQKLRVETAEDFERYCVNWLRTADQHIGSTRGDAHSQLRELASSL